MQKLLPLALVFSFAAPILSQQSNQPSAPVLGPDFDAPRRHALAPSHDQPDLGADPQEKALPPFRVSITNCEP
jgi:hypothetical protein